MRGAIFRVGALVSVLQKPVMTVGTGMTSVVIVHGYVVMMARNMMMEMMMATVTTLVETMAVEKTQMAVTMAPMEVAKMRMMLIMMVMMVMPMVRTMLTIASQTA